MKMCSYCRSMHDLKQCPNCGSDLAIDFRILAAMMVLMLNGRR
jgi:RNA polymerase subunit RPABC4/transcription elongation factor Spt4